MADSRYVKAKTEYMKAIDLEEHMEEGDLIEVERGAFQHWGICVCSKADAEGRPLHIINVSGDVLTGAGAIVGARSSIADVRVEDLRHMVGDSLVRVNNTIDAEFPPMATGDEVVKRALSRLGERQYNIMTTNCEHFANWCRNGHEVSYQAVRAMEKIEEWKKEPAAVQTRFEMQRNEIHSRLSEDSLELKEKVNKAINENADKIKGKLPEKFRKFLTKE